MSRKGSKGRGGQYEVGYGKPPVAGQFKKGQSGNPKGRRRGVEKPAIDLFASVLGEKVNVTLEGKKTTMTRLEFLMRNNIANAAKSPRDLRHVLAILEKFNMMAPRETKYNVRINLVEPDGKVVEYPRKDQGSSGK